ncbi:hypothetical protein SEA_ZENTENO07_46 [Mycobacterium phage Zenteno07]|nr:hypothetical protein SEA_ZENTENO07_46 [Mycobacterium phage Zenteno07]
MPGYRGSTPIIARYRGATPITRVYRGSTLVWSAATVRDPFDCLNETNPLDCLLDWINEQCTDPGGLFADPFGGLVDGLGNPVGQITKFVQEGYDRIGTLVSGANTSLADAYCGMWGGTAPPDGLLGLVNGVPIFGPIISGGIKSLIELLDSIFGGGGDPTEAITSIVGKVPIVGDVAKMIGLVPGEGGFLGEGINFVTDAFGEVIGSITCGAYTGVGGIGEGICFVIGVIGNAARMIIPDGLMSLNKQTSRLRHAVPLLSDDGFLETEVAELGSPGMATQLFRRYANDGSGARGVGLHLEDSVVSLVRRVGGVDTIVTPGGLGAFGPASRLRLVQAGNTHTVLRDGEPLGQPWIDGTGTAATGALNRSVAMTMRGAKELFGTRKFSPSLSYVEAA